MGRARYGSGRLWVVTAFVLACHAAASPSEAASRYDSRLRFHVLATPHFRIYFHQGGDQPARRLAAIAEETYRQLAARLPLALPQLTHVVLADQDDVPNGWAAPLPYNTIELVAGPPGPSSPIGNTDDWLRLVFAHEYAHIVYLDRSGGIAAALRAIFGRVPPAFPNLFQPLWAVEGFATWQESHLTGRGRLAAADFAAIVSEPARAGRPLPLDVASSQTVVWPAGSAPYAFGGAFHAFLAERFGDQALAKFAETTARGYYFLPGSAFRRVFDQRLGDLWRQFQTSRLQGEAPDERAATMPRRLTFSGYETASPLIVAPPPDAAPSAQAVSSWWVAYSVRNADDFPAVMMCPVDGSAPPRLLAQRYGGTRLTSFGPALVFDQVEIEHSVALRSDLYMLDPASRTVRRLTAGRRLVEPDVSCDGSRLVAVRLLDGTRTLVVYDLAMDRDGRMRVPEHPVMELHAADARFGSPRWSPDGRRVAAERWTQGGVSEIVVIDVVTGDLTVVAASERGRNITPAWAPDGQMLVFASDREGEPFRLYAVDADGILRRGPAVAGGATDPRFVPDGSALIYVGYTHDGQDLFVEPRMPSRWEVVAAAGRLPGGDIPSSGEHATPDGFSESLLASRYSPLPTLLPRAWLPKLLTENGRLKAGVMTEGMDVLGRHAFSVSAVWRVAGGAAADRLSARPDWDVSYVYDRWLPVVFATVSDHAGRITPALSLPSAGTRRALGRRLDVTAGVAVPLRRIRRTQLWEAAVAFERETPGSAAAGATRNRHAFRAAWGFSNARMYGFSISPEQGLSLGIVAEVVSRTLGADGNAAALAAQARIYPRVGWRHAVLALRAGIGTSRGDARVRRLFSLGGSSPLPSVTATGTEALAMLRGFADGAFAAPHIAVAGADYRFPLARVDRGAGTLPAFARAVHGAVFVDAGNTWQQQFQVRSTHVSCGGEVSLDLVLGYRLPVTLAAGAAWTHEAGGHGASGPAAFVRIGHAF